MKSYIVYDTAGTIVRTGNCPDHLFDKQIGKTSTTLSVLEGQADDLTQKIDMQSGSPVVIPKTQAEIDADKPPVVDPLDRQAPITNRQWQQLQARLAKLENP